MNIYIYTHYVYLYRMYLKCFPRKKHLDLEQLHQHPTVCEAWTSASSGPWGPLWSVCRRCRWSSTSMCDTRGRFHVAPGMTTRSRGHEMLEGGSNWGDGEKSTLADLGPRNGGEFLHDRPPFGVPFGPKPQRRHQFTQQILLHQTT